MKTCPYCNNPIPEGKDICPSCGAKYWDQNMNQKLKEPEEINESEERKGCLPLLFIPLLLSLAVTILLIFIGFVINIATHFEYNQIKFIWIVASLLAGGIFYLLFRKIKNKS